MTTDTGAVLLRQRRTQEHARRLSRMWSADGGLGIAAPLGRVRQRGDGLAVPTRSGTVYPGTVGTDQIQLMAVQAPQLDDASVTTPKLADGSVTGPKVPAGELGARELANGAVTIPKFAQGTRPVQLVDALPDLPDDEFPPGAAIVNMSDGKVYRHSAPDDVWGETWLADWPDSDGWTAQVDTYDLRGLIEEGQIGEGAVVAGTVAANAIGAVELAAIYVEVGKWIRSFDWEPGVSGWAIDGDGNAEFLDATFRGNIVASSVTSGQLVSANYQPGSNGWALDASGNAELNDATFRGNIVASSVSAGQLVSANYSPGNNGWALDANGNAEFAAGTWRGNISVAGGTVMMGSQGIAFAVGSTQAHRIKFGSAPFGADGEIFMPTVNLMQINAPHAVQIKGLQVGNSALSFLFSGSRVALMGVTNFGGEFIAGTNIRAGGDVIAEGHSTTTVSASCVMTSAGRLLRTTSSEAAKTAITDLPLSRCRSELDRLRPVTYRSVLPADDGRRVHVGLLAEEVAETVPALAVYDPDGTPIGVQYDRVGLLMLPVIRDLTERLAALEELVDA